MFDTTAVNFAIVKLSTALQSAVPTVKNISSEYVHYIVTRQILYTVEGLVCSVVSLLIFLGPVLKYGRATNESHTNYDEPGFTIPTIILALIFLCATYFFLDGIFGSILAMNYPEMFTIQEILNSTIQK